MQRVDDFNAAEYEHKQALIEHKQKNYSLALQHYGNALKLDPANPIIHYNLGLLFNEQGQSKYAIVQFSNVIRLAPTIAPAHFQLASLLLQQDDLDAAIEHFQVTLALQPEHLEALNNLGVAWLKKQDLNKAMDYFAQVLRIDENHMPARGNLAAAFLNQQQFLQAIHHYQTLLQKQNDNLEAHYNLGVAFMSIGQLSHAIEHYQQALIIKPDYLDVHINLGAIYLKMNDSAKALEHYQNAIQLQPENSTANYMTAAITQQSLPAEAPAAYIQDLFDSYAGHYDQHLLESLTYQIPQHIQQLLLQYCQTSNLHIWDLGCGTGLIGTAAREFAQYLVGVDLSAKMLAQAQAKQIYDKLLQADILTALTNIDANIDVLIAAEVLIYSGDLSPIFAACFSALKPGGLWIFTTEICHNKAYELNSTGRFAHSINYLQELAKTIGFVCLSRETVTSRLQDNQTLAENLIVLQKPMY